MSSLAETIAFVFGLIALGYLAGWTGLLRTQVGDAMTDFAVAIAVPVLLFRTLMNVDFHGAAPWELWFCYFSAVVVAWIVGQATIKRVFRRDAQAAVVGGIATSFSNLVLLGIPLVLGVFGQAGFDVLSLLISVHLLVMMAASVTMFELVGNRDGKPSDPLRVLRDFLRNLLVNPLVVGILAGLVWRMTGFGLPALGHRFVDALADLAGPVALFAMGLSLRKFGLSGHILPAFTLSMLKLMLMPAAALVMALLVGLPPLTAKIAVAAASLPTGVNPYLIATKFGTGQALASNTMTIGTACAALTTAFWLAVAQWVFG
ncbi:AEC family transporter [Aquamicrobium sp. LC103]|uniref:AEC family transporter n=1 Tax=Aquamicrobium sp. LC103 TaxID=1120658 RepID=UPI00063ED124|nr:AEC family transporter [Aquamicrobium sp. LC103]TKT79120.1 AEC family transporter [Aquamicrobium sp. LC103]